jgi:hypothetical protein
MTLFAAASEPQYGWGKLLALVIASAVFYGFTVAHKRWKSTQETPSPTPIESGASGVNPQVTASGATGVTTGGKALDVFVGARAGKVRTNDLVREAERRFRVSRRTVLRAISRAKAGTEAGS